MNHGGSGATYSNYGCRCSECTRAHRVRTARRRAERFAQPKDPNDSRHGKPSFYSNHGCRCEMCKSAWSASCAANYQKRKELAK